MKFKATLATLAKAARKYKWHLALVAALGLAYWLWCRRNNREPFFNSLKDAIAKVVVPKTDEQKKMKNREENEKVRAEGAEEQKVVQEKAKAQCPNGGAGYKLKIGTSCQQKSQVLVDGYCIYCYSPEEKARRDAAIASKGGLMAQLRKREEMAKKHCGSKGNSRNAFLPKKDGKCIEGSNMIDGYCIRCGLKAASAYCEHGTKNAAPIGSDGKCPSGYLDSNGPYPDKRCHLCKTFEEERDDVARKMAGK